MTTEQKQTEGGTQQRQYKRVSEVLKSQDFHLNARKVTVEDVEGKQLILWDAQIRDWTGEYGESQFVLFYASSVELPDDHFTFLAGGKAVVDKSRKLLQKRSFPVEAEFRSIVSESGRLYLDMQ